MLTFFHFSSCKTKFRCCDYGLGSITVTDAKGNQVWANQGGYGAYHSVTLEVREDGTIRSKDDQDIYVTPGAITTQLNFRDFTRSAQSIDPLWPGLYPQTLEKMVINVKLDVFGPEENAWKVWYLEFGKDRNKESDWVEILSVEGAFANQVTSHTVPVKPKGLYRFVIVDTYGGKL